MFFKISSVRKHPNLKNRFICRKTDRKRTEDGRRQTDNKREFIF